jgi:hypothetical protein
MDIGNSRPLGCYTCQTCLSAHDKSICGDSEVQLRALDKHQSVQKVTCNDNAFMCALHDTAG